ncbi:hypothetical protein CSHISOI_04771 [Colletotrichum shisoi]|uniref:Uncharacterized protein n=1 Tax=Colletotrichum shisoi TaxID=2078593 RepID=A0A5Q4BTT2_9PEZI|nr:hypothetical protein CSHISOI_04771 [Colletotrichum shisoi]
MVKKNEQCCEGEDEDEDEDMIKVKKPVRGTEYWVSVQNRVLCTLYSVQTGRNGCMCLGRCAKGRPVGNKGTPSVPSWTILDAGDSGQDGFQISTLTRARKWDAEHV